MTTLDGTAILEIERLTNEAHTVIIPDGEQQGVYYLRQPDGTQERFQASLDPRKATTIYDLESFGREASRQDHDGDYLDGVYVSAAQIVADLNDTTATWGIKMALPYHPAFQLVDGWQKPTGFDQKALVRLLRTQLSAYVSQTLIDTFQHLRVTGSSDVTTNARPTSVALDSRITRQVQGENGTAVPDFISVNLPVYDVRELRADRYSVQVYVEYDHDKNVFWLSAVHDQLRGAQEKAVESVISALQADERIKTTVLYGKPSA